MAEVPKLLAVMGDEVGRVVSCSDRACAQEFLPPCTRNGVDSFSLLCMCDVWWRCVCKQDTVTGFLLAGAGHRDARSANYLIVDGSTLPSVGCLFACLSWEFVFILRALLVVVLAPNDPLITRLMDTIRLCCVVPPFCPFQKPRRVPSWTSSPS
jgi:hypothetical protein